MDQTALNLLTDMPAGPLAVRAAIDELEAAMFRAVEDGTAVQTIFSGGTPEGDAQCRHYFGDGVYVRTLLIPAGTILVGRLHRQARVCLILTGRCTWVDETGRATVEAPWIGEFPAGSKTAVYAETDTLWAAALGTHLKDSATVFETLTYGTREQYEQFLEQLK